MSMLPPQDEALPQEPTPFLGRQAEMAALQSLLGDPACRLITLAGPGGIGKSRLAIEFAAHVRDQFADGVAFAALQSVPAAPFLASAIADALRLPLQGQDEPQRQLLQALRDKRLLLVLDNFEHLLDGTDLLLTLLRAAPEVTILVTSREVLNLREEWLFPVDGLAPPAGDSGDELRASQAGQLFAACALRVRRDFDLAAEAAAVARICRLVAGMPLAIELAAAWTKTLPCGVIANEIEGNLAFLEANLRDLPERHRSVRAAFDQSWRLLRADEQAVFRRLAVFRSGFTYDAAARIAGATLPLLAALVDKSLVRLDSQGRYQIHELLRQYAESHLAAEPAMLTQVQETHSTYYVQFLSARAAAMSGGRQREATHEIAGELENIRTAWQWAVAHADIEAIRQAEHPLSLYYAFRGPYQDGIALLDEAVQQVRNVPSGQARNLTLARLLVDMGMLAVQFGQLVKARAAFEESQSLYTALAIPPPAGLATDPLLGLAFVAVLSGDLAAAARYGAEARLRSESEQHSGNLPFAWYVLAVTARSQGQIKPARHYAGQAYATARAARNRWFMSTCLVELNDLARLAGDYAEARQHAQAAYTLREEFGDWQGMAVALYREGRVAVQQTDYLEARRLFQRSLEIAQELGDRAGCTTGFYGLALVACKRGEFALSRRYFVQALAIVSELTFVSWALSIFAGIAELLLRTGQLERASELAVLIMRHPAAHYQDTDQARQLLLQAETALAPALLAAAVQRGQALDVDAAIIRAQVFLSVPLPAFSAEASPDQADQAGAVAMPEIVEERLIEQLTPRELEVLRLIGDGLSNQAIAERLVLSHGTVRWYTQQIYSKLGVQSRTQAFARARNLRLLS